MTLPCLCPASGSWGTQGRTEEQKANNFRGCLLSIHSRPSPPSPACGCLGISPSSGICSKTSLGCLGVPVGRDPVRRAGQHTRREGAGNGPALPFRAGEQPSYCSSTSLAPLKSSQCHSLPPRSPKLRYPHNSCPAQRLWLFLQPKPEQQLAWKCLEMKTCHHSVVLFLSNFGLV